MDGRRPACIVARFAHDKACVRLRSRRAVCPPQDGWPFGRARPSDARGRVRSDTSRRPSSERRREPARHRLRQSTGRVRHVHVMFSPPQSFQAWLPSAWLTADPTAPECQVSCPRRSSTASCPARTSRSRSWRNVASLSALCYPNRRVCEKLIRDRFRSLL